MTVPSQSTTPEEVLDKHCKQLITNFDIQSETNVWDDWKQHITLDDGLAVYGKKEVTELFANGSLESLIIHFDIFDNKREKILTISKKVGCSINTISGISEAGNDLMNSYGGVVGVRWF